MLPAIANKSFINNLLPDVRSYLFAALSGIASFIGFIAFCGIILIFSRDFPSWGISIYIMIFIAPAILSGILSTFILRPYIKSIGDASIFGAFASATYGGLFFALLFISMYGAVAGVPSVQALKDYLIFMFYDILFLFMFEAFFTGVGAITGAITGKLLCFRTKRRQSR